MRCLNWACVCVCVSAMQPPKVYHCIVWIFFFLLFRAEFFLWNILRFGESVFVCFVSIRLPYFFFFESFRLDGNRIWVVLLVHCCATIRGCVSCIRACGIWIAHIYGKNVCSAMREKNPNYRIKMLDLCVSVVGERKSARVYVCITALRACACVLAVLLPIVERMSSKAKTKANDFHGLPVFYMHW